MREPVAKNLRIFCEKRGNAEMAGKKQTLGHYFVEVEQDQAGRVEPIGRDPSTEVLQRLVIPGASGFDVVTTIGLNQLPKAQ